MQHPHPFHNVDPLIYGDCAVCCVHYGPVLALVPLNDVVILDACGCSHLGLLLYGCDPDVSYNDRRDYPYNHPLVLYTQNPCCPPFPSQMFPASPGPDSLCPCDCGAWPRKKFGVGAFLLAPVASLPPGKQISQVLNVHGFALPVSVHPG